MSKRLEWLSQQRLAFVCLVAGALTTLAFAPFDFPPIALLTLLVLFRCWQLGGRRWAFFYGWSFGVGLLGFGVFWLHVSINQFGNLGLSAAMLITLAFVLSLSALFGVAGWLAERIAGEALAPRLLLVYPAVWVFSEWFRGWFLTGFPWLALGYSQIDTLLAGLAPLLGVYGVSWAVALSAGLLLFIWLAPGRPRALGALALLGIWGLAALAGGQAWSEPVGPPLQVSLVQGNVKQEMKWRPEQLWPTLELYRDLTRSHWASDLIVWPETAVPALYREVDDEYLAPLEAEAREHASSLLLGIPVREGSPPRYYNAMLSLGAERSVYFKRHLVPFGEYLPLKGLLQPMLTWLRIPMSDFSRGRAEKPLVQAAGHAVGITICYEDAFGEEVIEALPEAAFLVNASNDGWFGDSLAPHQHLQIARMRARETGRYLLRSTNTGISAVIGPAGELLATSPAFAQHVLSAEIQPRQGMSPYARFGNLGVLLLVALAVLLSVVLALRDRSS